MAVLMVLLLVRFDVTSRLDNLFYDSFSSAMRPDAPAELMIATIDDESLSRFGKWPWPRDRHAEMLAQLAPAPPRALVLDILFSDPGDAAGDARLARAMRGVPGLLLPVHYVAPGHNGADYDRVEPQPAFKAAASALGHVNIVLDEDGVLRRIALCARTEAAEKGAANRQAGDAPTAHIAEHAYRLMAGKPSATWRRGHDCGQPLLLPMSPRGNIVEVPYAALASGQVPASFWEDRLLLIGATAVGLGDHYPVPLADGTTLSGVEILANIYGALKRDDFIVPLGDGAIMLLSLLPVLLLLAGFWFWTPRQSLLASLAIILLLLAGSMVALWLRWWFPPGASLAALALVYPLWGWRRLAAVSDMLKEDIRLLRDEPGLEALPPLPAARMGDHVSAQGEALSHAILQLRDLRRFVSDALAHLPDPMIVTDMAGYVTLANHGARQSFGLMPSDTPFRVLLTELVDAEDRQAVDDFLSDRPDADAFVRFLCLGDHRRYLMRRTMLTAADGGMAGHIHYFTEITVLEEAQLAREQAIELLSHDMRAPQASILSLIEGAARDGVGADLCRRIAGHARRTLNLAENFVGLARLRDLAEQGEDVMPGEMAAEAADAFWPLARERGIRVEMVDESEESFVRCTPDGLHRALANLIDNAIKYSPDGGCVRLHVRPVAGVGRRMMALSVDDDGPGIAPALMPHLFTRFAHGGGGRGRVAGTGLGLAFVARFAASHGGSVHASSREVGGTRLTLLLPIVD